MRDVCLRDALYLKLIPKKNVKLKKKEKISRIEIKNSSQRQLFGDSLSQMKNSVHSSSENLKLYFLRENVT